MKAKDARQFAATDPKTTAERRLVIAHERIGDVAEYHSRFCQCAEGACDAAPSRGPEGDIDLRHWLDIREAARREMGLSYVEMARFLAR